MTRRVHVLLAGMVFVAVVGTYLSSSTPDSVVVNESGEITGPINKLRAALQGQRFWKDQLVAVKNELNQKLAEPERMAQINSEIAKTVQSANAFMENMYKVHPEFRPAPAFVAADAVRERADAIEHAALMQMLEQHRLARIAELRRILPIVESRANRNGT